MDEKRFLLTYINPELNRIDFGWFDSEDKMNDFIVKTKVTQIFEKLEILSVRDLMD